MISTIGSDAAKPNPALAHMRVLVGTWTTVGTHPMVPGVTLHGRTSFEWIEGGAFLMMRSEIDHPDFPSGIAIVGADDSSGARSMLYFDERAVSRRYETTLQDNVWSWWRDDAEFSQRFRGTISADGRTIVGHGEMSRDGAAWEKDLQLTYTRAG